MRSVWSSVGRFKNQVKGHWSPPISPNSSHWSPCSPLKFPFALLNLPFCSFTSFSLPPLCPSSSLPSLTLTSQTPPPIWRGGISRVIAITLWSLTSNLRSLNTPLFGLLRQGLLLLQWLVSNSLSSLWFCEFFSHWRQPTSLIENHHRKLAFQSPWCGIGFHFWKTNRVGVVENLAQKSVNHTDEPPPNTSF